jgi:hypothetical protein
MNLYETLLSSLCCLLCCLCKKNEKPRQKKKKKEKRFSSFSLEGEKTNFTTKEEERSFAQKFCLLYILHTRKVCLFSLITEEEDKEDKWRSSTTRASIRFIT